MKKRLLSILLVMAMVVTMLAGCSSSESTSGDDGNTSTATQTPSDGGTTTSDGATTADKYAEPYVIDIFDVAANYQGTQTGWFAQVVKDKFNIELNIISPQVSGDAVFQTRASTGNLGDIVLLEKIQFGECIENGLIKDITTELKNCSNLMAFEDQITTLNESFPGNDGKLYGIPCEMVNSSPTSYSQDVIYSSPLMRWDLYQGIGAPDIADLDGLLDALQTMMEKYPTNDAGDACYPFSLWSDWDGGDGMMGIANVVQLTTWYGEKIRDSIILKPDDTFTEVIDKSASYYKILKFLNDAYVRGLVDPDSGTQTWDNACAKMTAGQVYLMWYSWQVGFWNSLEKQQNGTAFRFIPVKDQLYYTDSDTYYGSGRVFGVGSQVEGDKLQRIIDFLDWYGSPEGATLLHNGIEGFNYEIGADGRYVVKNDDALMANLPVPEEYGGAGYQDGMSAINQWIIASTATNPVTGELYASQYWSTYKEATQTQMREEWTAKFGAAEDVEYMKNNNALLVSPSVSVTLPSDTTDISVIRSQCGDVFCDYSWRMIFAEDDAAFDALWDDMTEQMKGFGYDELVQFDLEKYQIELDAKKAARN